MKFYLKLLLLTCAMGWSQVPAIQWQKMYGDPDGWAGVYAINPTADGGYIVASTASSGNGDVASPVKGAIDYWVFKTDASGAIQWSKTYGGSDVDWPTDVQQTPDGGYIVVGYSRSTDGDVSNHHPNDANDPYTKDDIWVVKISSTGALMWEKSIGGSQSDYAYSVVVNADGSCIVAGNSESTNGDINSAHPDDAVLVKLDASGNMVWLKTYGGSGYEEFKKITKSADGGYFMYGNTQSTDGDVVGFHGNNDLWAVKVNANGDLAWQHALGGSGQEWVNGGQTMADGSCVIVGTAGSPDGDVMNAQPNFMGWVVRLNAADGSIVMNKILGQSGSQEMHDVYSTPDGKMMLCGFMEPDPSDPMQGAGSFDGWVVKMDLSGNVQWQTLVGDPYFDQLFTLCPSPDGGFVTVGFHNDANYYQTAWLVKWAPETLVGPAPPTSSAQSFCNSATVGQLAATGSNLQWYSLATGGSPLSSSTTLQTGTYYVSQTVNGLESNRTSVTVTINTTPALAVATFYITTNTRIQDVFGFSSIYNIYATATSTTPLALTTILTNGTYYTTQTINGCESARTANTVVTYNAPTVRSSTCGTTLSSISAAISCSLISNATNYKFEVTSGGQTQLYYSTINSFNLTQLPNGASYNTAYSIRVAAGFSGQYGNFGAACTVTTPGIPATSLTSTSCGINTNSRWTRVYCNQVYGATSYQFNFRRGSLNQSYISSTNSMQLASIPGLAPNTTYVVSVQAIVGTVYGATGSTCNVTLSPTYTRHADATETVWSIKAVPNPFTSDFALLLTSDDSSSVAVQVFDMTGRLVEQFDASAHELRDLALGQQYAAGIYNICITQNESTQWVRVVKK